MSYEVGSVIDISHVNPKPARSQRSTSASQFLFDVGTSLKFIATEAGYRSARSIPVAFA